MSEDTEIIFTGGAMGYGDGMPTFKSAKEIEEIWSREGMPDAIKNYHGAPVTFMGPSLDTGAQAVQLLRDIVAIDPYSPYGDSPCECLYCKEWFKNGHYHECTWARAKAFLDALDVK